MASGGVASAQTRGRRLPSRRDVLAGVAGLGAWAAGITPWSTAAADPFVGVELPPDIGQSDLQVYAPVTGHTLKGTFLDYWRANGAASVFGWPVSEPFPSADGYYAQAFERAVLQYRPEFLWTDEPIVRPMPIHQTLLRDRLDVFRPDGRRAGGGVRPPSRWRALDPSGRTVARVLSDGGRFDAETGHTISGEILAWYEAHEGHFYLGHPVSEPVDERGLRVQYFEGGVLEVTGDDVRLAPLPDSLLASLGIDTTPVEGSGLPAFDETLFWGTTNPYPLADAAGPGRKWLEIALGAQQLWAYAGGTAVLSSLVSTGLDPNFTEQGLFRIRLKYPVQDMQGFTNATGEVTAVGSETPASGIPYAVEDVPHVMYFNLDAEALHGAYWHSNFGAPMSHGCVNLPLEVAAFLYGWAPLGTMVWVHE
jgi:hypothetical protein